MEKFHTEKDDFWFAGHWWLPEQQKEMECDGVEIKWEAMTEGKNQEKR